MPFDGLLYFVEHGVGSASRPYREAGRHGPRGFLQGAEVWRRVLSFVWGPSAPSCLKAVRQRHAHGWHWSGSAVCAVRGAHHR